VARSSVFPHFRARWSVGLSIFYCSYPAFSGPGERFIPTKQRFPHGSRTALSGRLRWAASWSCCGLCGPMLVAATWPARIPGGCSRSCPAMAATCAHARAAAAADRRGLSLVPVLLQELAGLQVRIMQTARDTYRAWRHSRLNSLGVVHRVLRSRAVIEDNHQRNARLGCCVRATSRDLAGYLARVFGHYFTNVLR